MPGFDHEGMERRLNDLGREGWEAVSSLQPSIGAAPTDILVLLREPGDTRRAPPGTRGGRTRPPGEA